MKVLDLLSEIEEIVNTSSGMPLTGKVLVDAGELLQVVKDIRLSLPDEIQQAQFITGEKERLLQESKNEYETIIHNAEIRADELVATHRITELATEKANEMITATEENCRQLKMSTYDYVDSILYKLEDTVNEFTDVYFKDMYKNIEDTFGNIVTTISQNRDEIKSMAYNTQMTERK